MQDDPAKPRVPTSELEKLAALVTNERLVLLTRWRAATRALPSASALDVPTLNDHVPSLLDELALALESGSTGTISARLAAGSSPAHGLQRVEDGFDIEEVVSEYNILRGCIHDLAEERSVTLEGQPFRILNRVLDSAIGLAVGTFAAQRAADVQRRRDEYLAFVVHDLRTPLNAISLAVDVLELGANEQTATARSARMASALRRNVKHLEALVSRVMDENENLESPAGVTLVLRHVDLWPLVEALLQDLHTVAADARTRLVNEVPPEMVVYADASALRRVLQNLLANAIKYTPQGEVTIGARELGDGRGVECWVQDDGAGIPQARIGAVFDKGETDPNQTGGSGLGLAIVKSFVEAHGGTVTVESEVGRGASFRFVLPSAR